MCKLVKRLENSRLENLHLIDRMYDDWKKFESETVHISKAQLLKKWLRSK